MKPNQKNRYHGRYNNNRGSRSVIMRNTVLESSGPCGKFHGTPLQLFEKYQAAAKDAVIQRDLVLAEICMQHADHYMRLQNQAIANEQSMRPQQQQQSQSQAQQVKDVEVASDTADELPDIVVPSEKTTSATKVPHAKKSATVTKKKTKKESEPIQGSDEDSEADRTLKAMDLSIPVLAIQEKHIDQPKAKSFKQKREVKEPRPEVN